MTPKQLRILHDVGKFIGEFGHAPSIRELCERNGVKSSSTMHGYLARLKKSGHLDWDESHPRTLKVVRYA